MKYTLLLLFSILSTTVYAGEESNISKLNPDLQKIYSAMKSGEKLIGNTYTIKLNIKFYSKDFLILNDGYVKIDSTTKYSFIKFEKGMSFPSNIIKGKPLPITFKIKEVRNTEVAGNMPHIFVKLMRVGL